MKTGMITGDIQISGGNKLRFYSPGVIAACDLTSPTTGSYYTLGSIIAFNKDVLRFLKKTLFANTIGTANDRGITFGTSAPTDGTWTRGDIVFNSLTSELGSEGSKYILSGWRCVSTGTPGTWLEMRTLTGN
jgi:hypothetical protein